MALKKTNRGMIHEHSRKTRDRWHRRDTDRSSGQQTGRAAEIDRRVSGVGRAPRHGGRRANKKRFDDQGLAAIYTTNHSQPFWPEEVAAILGITPGVSLAGGNGGGS